MITKVSQNIQKFGTSFLIIREWLSRKLKEENSDEESKINF